MPPCEECAVSKAKRKNISITPRPNYEQPLSRVGVDISSIKAPRYLKHTVYKPHWRLVICHLTGYMNTEFFESKRGMVQPTIELFKSWERDGYPVNYVRCDNAGENKKLESRLKSTNQKIYPKFEYTAKATPQQNSLSEKGYVTDTTLVHSRRYFNVS